MPGWMRLRQVVLAARDLEPVADQLRTVLGLGPGFHDPGVAEFGIRNEVIPIGDTFLEVVSPIQPNTAAGRFLDRRAGDGGYMLLLQTDDVARDRRRFADLGVRVIWKADLPDISGTHLHPKDIGGTIVSIDEARPPESWRWGGPAWPNSVRTDVTTEILAVELQTADPRAMSRRWSEVLALPVRPSATDAYEIPLDRGLIRFVPDRDGRGDSLSAFEVGVSNRQRLLDAAQARGRVTADGQIRIGGTRIALPEV